MRGAFVCAWSPLLFLLLLQLEAATAVKYHADFAVKFIAYNTDSFKPRNGPCGQTCSNNKYNFMSAVSDAMGVPEHSLTIMKAQDSTFFADHRRLPAVTLFMRMTSSDLLQMGIVDNMLNSLVRRDELKSEMLQQFQYVGMVKATKCEVLVSSLQTLNSGKDTHSAAQSIHSAQQTATPSRGRKAAGGAAMVVAVMSVMLVAGFIVQKSRSGAQQTYQTIPESTELK